MLICAVCGKSDVKVSPIRGICKDCFVKQGLIRNIKPLKITICPRCFRIKKDRWIRMDRFEDIEVFVEKALESRIITKDGVKLDFIEVSLSKDLTCASVEMDLALLDYGEMVSMSINLGLDLKKTLCDNCLRLKTENYEALIQLRSKNINLIDEFESTLRTFFIEGEDFLIRRERFEYGLDAYFSSLSQARRIAHEFKRKHFCRYKETKSIVSGSKYRYTILLDFK